MANAIPHLFGLSRAVTFAENAVNAAPQRLDIDVSFTGPDFAGGTLTVTGLLAEDRISLASDGVIGLSNGAVRYHGTVVGNLIGGQGSTLSIAFNAQSSAAAVEAVIERLTYANVSDLPTLTRVLTLDVVDAAGARALAGFSTTRTPQTPSPASTSACSARRPWVT